MVKKDSVKKLQALIYTADFDIEKFRHILEKTFYVPTLPNNVECEYKKIQNIECSILYPTVFSKSRIIVYIHGGSFVGGSPAAWQSFCSSLAHESCTTIIIPQFRLAPKAPFPAALEDIQNVLASLFNSGQDIILVADGSGASITLGAVLSLEVNLRKKIKNIVLFSPWLDFSDNAEAFKINEKKNRHLLLKSADLRSAAELYTYSENFTNPLVSPMYADLEMLANFPPIYIQYVKNELLEKDIVCFSEKLTKAKIPCILDEWVNVPYMFQMADDDFFEAHIAVEEAGKHIKRT